MVAATSVEHALKTRVIMENRSVAALNSFVVFVSFAVQRLGL
jgi:hypothetical protein